MLENNIYTMNKMQLEVLDGNYTIICNSMFNGNYHQTQATTNAQSVWFSVLGLAFLRLGVCKFSAVAIILLQQILDPVP